MREIMESQNLFDSDGDNSAQACRTSSGWIDYIHVINSNAVDTYLQLFDAAIGDVTVGSTTPTLSLLIPAGDGASAGAFEQGFVTPLRFKTAITYACTTGATNGTDPTTGLTVNIQHH